MRKSTAVFVWITIATFLGFFVVEALIWNLPFVSALLVPQLNPALAYPVQDQARTLAALFVNQGVYNLMVALGGIAGVVFIRSGRAEVGRFFVVYTCLFALGAAITLLLSTHAYILGAVQAAFPIAALISLRGDPMSGRQ